MQDNNVTTQYKLITLGSSCLGFLLVQCMNIIKGWTHKRPQLVKDQCHRCKDEKATNAHGHLRAGEVFLQGHPASTNHGNNAQDEANILADIVQDTLWR